MPHRQGPETMRSAARLWIDDLGLVAHPEGGFYRETYRAAEEIPATALPARFGGPRTFGTAIYYLLPAGDFSSLHRLASDEIWHFYAGAPLDLHIISPSGHYRTQRLGAAPRQGEAFQIVIEAGHWFGATVSAGGTYTLAGCTVAPGFDFADFELADRASLSGRFPRHAGLIRRLTRR